MIMNHSIVQLVQKYTDYMTLKLKLCQALRDLGVHRKNLGSWDGSNSAAAKSHVDEELQVSTWAGAESPSKVLGCWEFVAIPRIVTTESIQVQLIDFFDDIDFPRFRRRATPGHKIRIPFIHLGKVNSVVTYFPWDLRRQVPDNVTLNTVPSPVGCRGITRHYAQQYRWPCRRGAVYGWPGGDIEIT